MNLFYILDNHLPIKRNSDKYPHEMKNREEMRQNDPGNCAFWNVGLMCPEMPVYQEASQHGTQREGERGLGSYN